MAPANLMRKFELEFERMRKELGIKATLDELDAVFFFRDYVLAAGFVSPALSRTLARRINEMFQSWAGYLHTLVMPNPANMLNITESQVFTETEKKEMIRLIARTMEFGSRNAMIGITKDRAAEARFFDEALAFWKGRLSVKQLEILRKVNATWKEKAEEKESPPARQQTDFN